MLQVGYFGGPIDILLVGIIVFIITLAVSAFSPFGIGFIISSVVRGKSENSHTKRIGLIFQIICLVLTAVIGILVAIFLSIESIFFNSYWYWDDIILKLLFLGLPVFLGVMAVGVIELAIIIWESYWIKSYESTSKVSRYK